MNLILIPGHELATFISLVAGVVAAYAALYYLNRSVRVIRDQRKAAELEIWNYMGRLHNALEQAHLEQDHAVRQAGETPVSGRLPVELNSQLRTKVLKMRRLGHSTQRISAHLGLPMSELELLFKVNDMVMRQFEPAGASQTIGLGTK